MVDNLRYKKEYYFNMYFKQAELAKQTRELIEQLNLTKKEIVESETYIKALGYSDFMDKNQVAIFKAETDSDVKFILREGYINVIANLKYLR